MLRRPAEHFANFLSQHLEISPRLPHPILASWGSGRQDAVAPLRALSPGAHAACEALCDTSTVHLVFAEGRRSGVLRSGA